MSEPFFFQTPSELVAHLREHQAHDEMNHEHTSHRIRDFIDSLDSEQLEVFEILVKACGDDSTRFHLRGRIMEAQRRFGVCPCGKDHSKVPEDMQPDPVPEKATEPHPDMPSREELMKLYTLESNPDYGMKDWEQRYETVPQPFRCSNCGMGYVSLEDRMLRPPGIDGCGGCRLKSAHG